MSFVDQLKKKVWKNKLVVGFAIKLRHTKGPDATKKTFDTKLLKGLAFVQEYVQEGKLGAVIMPREDADKDVIPISFKEDIPKFQLVTKKNTSR